MIRIVLIICVLMTLPKVIISQHIPYIHEQLVEDFKLFDKAYRDAFRKSNGPTCLEDWAIVQKYKVQLTDSRLIFDQAFDEDFLSKGALKEYLELLLYQNEFARESSGALS